MKDSHPLLTKYLMKTKSTTSKKDISTTISTHLGKAGDGSVVKPYITPDRVTPSLLVGVPRRENRDNHDINPTKFCGYDTWYCYEFSLLSAKGSPLNYILRISYDCQSENIVESKSLKLYLNSFNMDKNLLGKYNTNLDATKILKVDINKSIITHQIFNDLSPVLKTNNIKIDVIDPVSESDIDNIQPYEYNGEYIDETNLEFEISDMSGRFVPHLKLKEAHTLSSLVKIKCGNLRSNCRVTNQPDWGCVYVILNANQYIKKVLEHGALAKYVASFRNENHFHEEVCELIFNDLVGLGAFQDVFVGCCYTRRGGIDINPMRSTDSKLLAEYGILNKPIRYISQ